MRIETKNLVFTLNEMGSRARFSAPGTSLTCAQGDFWQLTLQDPARQVDEISVNSSAQTRALLDGSDDSIRITYEPLIDEYGDTHAIRLEVFVRREGERIVFKTRVTNNTDGLRVLESRCPVARFHSLCGAPEQDVLYMPDGLGKRLKNPWAQNTFHTQHMQDYAHAQPDYTWNVMYPAASMAWMGFETGGKLLYVGRHDEDIRLCAFRVQVPHPMGRTRQMMMTVAHLPAAQPGETVETAESSVALLDGDWRAGADMYRAFAQSTFYKPWPKKDWARHMHGFQRVHRQLSWEKRAAFTFEDLPGAYLEGRKYGIDTLLFFNWWDTPFDAENPIHDISPENAERLRAAIREVQRLGGHVITECNATYVVVNSPYYKEFGAEVAHLDAHGNDDLALHGVAVDSIWRAVFPFRHYVHGCCGSAKWRETLVGHAQKMKTFEPDGMFYDCFGAWSCQPCYNNAHDHDNRVDQQWAGRRSVFESVRAICGDEQAVSNEVVTDIAANYAQILHTLTYNQYNSDFDFPYLFRYTFPDAIVTNRFINNECAGFDRQLRYDFVIGMRFDVGELGGYATDKQGGARYAQVVGELNSLRAQYADFMMDGTFTVRDTSPLPHGVVRAEYEAQDGRLLRVLYNLADEPSQAAGVLLQPDEIHFAVIPAQPDSARQGG